MRISSQTWNPEFALSDAVEGKLTSYFGEPEQEDDYLIWFNSKLFGLHNQKIRLDTDDCEVSVDTVGHDVLYYLLIGVSLAFYIFVLSSNLSLGGLSLLFGFFIYSSILYQFFTPNLSEELADFADLSNQENRPFSFVFIGSGILLLWYKFHIHYPSTLVNLFIILVSLIFFAYSFSFGLIPWVSVSPSLRILATPVTALFWLLLPPILYIIFAFQPGYIYLQAKFHQDIFQNMTLTRFNASIITDMYGNVPSIDSIDVIVAQRSLEFFAVVIVIIIVVLVLMTVQAKRQLSGFSAINVAKFESPKVRLVSFLIFFSSNIAILLMSIPAAVIVFYGLFETFPIGGSDLLYTRAFTFEPLQFQVETAGYVNNSSMTESIVIQESRQVQPEELVIASYEVLDKAFSKSTIIPSRALSVSFFIFMFTPHILLGSYWIYSLYSDTRKKVKLLSEGEELDRDSEVVPENIQVLVFEGDKPSALAHPISILFGWKDYIIVSKFVKQELEPDELDAVLAHEVYHIRNQDLRVNAVAKLVSLGFGGSNALLAFYNYPKIEEEADLYAREKKGVMSTVTAIDKMDVISKRCGGITLPNASPGFISNIITIIQSNDDSHPNIRNKSQEYITAPYKLLFGKIILQSAHTKPRERIARLEQD